MFCAGRRIVPTGTSDRATGTTPTAPPAKDVTTPPTQHQGAAVDYGTDIYDAGVTPPPTLRPNAMR
jgi:hypothetical protein